MVDASNEAAPAHMHVVYETLRKLGVKDKPVITVFNKQDVADPEEVLKDLNADKCIGISALTGQGLDELAESVEKILLSQRKVLDVVIGFMDGGLLQMIRKDGTILEEEYIPEGIRVKAYVPDEIYGKVLSCLNIQ